MAKLIRRSELIERARKLNIGGSLSKTNAELMAEIKAAELRKKNRKSKKKVGYAGTGYRSGMAYVKLGKDVFPISRPILMDAAGDLKIVGRSKMTVAELMCAIKRAGKYGKPAPEKAKRKPLLKIEGLRFPRFALLDAARELKIKGASRMTSQEIYDAIKTYENMKAMMSL